MKRQGLIVTLNKLHDLIDELSEEFPWDGPCKVTDDDRKFQINIVNKKPECSDTWEIEYSQRKKDEDDGSNVSLSGDTKQLQGQTDKDEHMPASVDNHVDNPQDDPGEANVADNGDTGDGTFPADSKSRVPEFKNKLKDIERRLKILF